jgi:hypothetical protein
MKWIVDNWSLLVVAAIIIAYMLISGKKSIQKWLLYGVFMAESEWGSGTGKLKLHTVYDMFVSKYPIISKILPFAVFSLWVDEVLKEMKKTLEENKSINQLIIKE